MTPLVKTEYLYNKSADLALQQIKDNDYARKYQRTGKPITLVGANFDSEERKISEWKEETL